MQRSALLQGIGTIIKRWRKKLREDEWGEKVPVIVLTNLSDNEDILKAMEEDVFEYFVKTDIKINEVIARIREKIGR